MFARVDKVVQAFEGAAGEGDASRIVATARANKPEPPPQSKPLINVAQRGASKQEIEAATTDILRESGKPLKLRVLFHELIKKGIAVGGQNPTANLSAHLSGSSHFETASDGWWFRGQPRPTNKNAPEGASLI